MTTSMWDQSVETIAAQVRRRQVSAREVTARALARIESTNGQINAFVAVDGERALAQAARIDEDIVNGRDVGPLAGVPVGVKDLEDADGFVTSYGSALRANDTPAKRDSVLVARLRRAGCVIVGKTNTPEYGHKGMTDNPLFGATVNPWNRAYTCGGSSGGSAAAIAAGMVPLATGSDGGGSIRLPSSLCALSGIKTSQGAVAIANPNPPGSGVLTVVGPMARRTRDVAYALDAVVGPHPADPFAHPMSSTSWRAALDGRPPAAVVWSPTVGYGTNDSEITAACSAAVERLEEAGTRVIRVDRVFDEDPIRAWWTMWIVARFKAQGHLIGTTDWERISESLRPQIEAGAKVTGVDYARAIDEIYLLAARLEAVFAEHAPYILTPTIAGHPPLIGSDKGTIAGAETIGWVQYTPFVNLTRNPAGSVCVGRSSVGVPIGMQIIGRQLDDLGVLQVMTALEDLIAFDDTPIDSL